MANIKKKKREEFNDLLIPILLVLCVMPFIIHLAEYSCGYEKYSWYSNQDVIWDIYSYFRCYFFEILAIFSLAVVIFRMGLYKEKRKNYKYFIPLLVYGIMALISTVLSVNPTASITGNFYQFQGIVVILGYVIMCFYTYQIMDKERDYKIIFGGIIVLFLIMVIIGIFQMAKQDLLNFPWVQRLIMSKEQFSVYGGEIDTVFTGRNVFLTLYNPNYAGVFLTMLASVFGIMFYSEKYSKKKVGFGVLFLLSLILIWFTYSRSTLISLAVALVLFLFLIKEKTANILKYLLPGILFLAVIFVGIDVTQDFKYLSRIVDEKKEVLLEEMLTTEKGVEIFYHGEQFLITVEENMPVVYDESGNKVITEVGSDREIIIPLEREIYAWVELEGEKAEYLHLFIENQTFTFGFREEGYYYINENGKEDQLEEIKKVDMGGYEYLGSGRLYIWSRTLPMLKDFLLVGSGPDTFPEVFPQKDYVGKALYADTSARIIEKPHNDYFMQWVQNGFLGCLGMICFYGIVLWKGIKTFRKKELRTIKDRLGMGCFMGCICYMVGSIFNDSTLYTTPVFWIFAGIVLAVGEKDNSL